MSDDQKLYIKRLKTDQGELIKFYDRIYQAGTVRHHAKGLMGPYGSHGGRNPWFLKKIAEIHLLPGSSVLDASCGRGHLLKQLLDLGYRARGTEVVKSQFKEGASLADLPADLVTYDDLASFFPKRSFDLVISNDVLEHMIDEAAVIRAIENLCAISNEWIMISVGCKGAPKYPSALGIVFDLHRVRRNPKWWTETMKKYVDDLKVDPRGTGGWWGYGRVKK